MGRDYPQGYDFFRSKCNAAFKRNVAVTDVGEIEKLLTHGEYVIKELKALYYLKKYRTLKRRYYGDDIDMSKFRILSAYTSEKVEKYNPWDLEPFTIVSPRGEIFLISQKRSYNVILPCTIFKLNELIIIIGLQTIRNSLTLIPAIYWF